MKPTIQTLSIQIVIWLYLKGMVHLKIKILSFTCPQVVSNLYVEHKRRYFEECW